MTVNDLLRMIVLKKLGSVQAFWIQQENTKEQVKWQQVLLLCEKLTNYNKAYYYLDLLIQTH